MDGIRKQATRLREQGAKQQQVMHSHMAETDVELSLSVGDYVVVRKVKEMY